MRFVGGTGNSEDAAAYNGELASGPAKVIIFPLVRNRPSNGPSLATAVGIQNLTSDQWALVTLYYYADSTNCSGEAITPISYSIQPGGSYLRNHRFDDLPVGWGGSLVVVSNLPYINGFEQLRDINSVQGMGDTYMNVDAIAR